MCFYCKIKFKKNWKRGDSCWKVSLWMCNTATSLCLSLWFAVRDSLYYLYLFKTLWFFWRSPWLLTSQQWTFWQCQQSLQGYLSHPMLCYANHIVNFVMETSCPRIAQKLPSILQSWMVDMSKGLHRWASSCWTCSSNTGSYACNHKHWKHLIQHQMLPFQ